MFAVGDAQTRPWGLRTNYGAPTAPLCLASCACPIAPAASSFAVVLVLLFLLAGGGPGAHGCVPCGGNFKNLKIRFAQLCAQYQKRYGQANCTKYPWGRESARDLALDQHSLDLLMEKTHRVFRVIEINQSLADFPKYWDWLHEVKMPAQSREVLCPPACQGIATAFNCSTCRKVDMPCWDLDTCYPVIQDHKVIVSSQCDGTAKKARAISNCIGRSIVSIADAVLLPPLFCTDRKGLQYTFWLLNSLAGSCLFLGLVSCALEFWLHPGIRAE